MVRKEFDSFGTIRYYNDKNQFHREDGPAVEHPNGYKSWYLHGLRHRIDGPAKEWGNTNKDYYYLIGKLFSYEDWLAIKDFPLLW